MYPNLINDLIRDHFWACVRAAQNNPVGNLFLRRARELHGSYDFRIKYSAPNGEILIPSWYNPYLRREATTMNPAIERFWAHEQTGSRLLSELGEPVEYLFIDLTMKVRLNGVRTNAVSLEEAMMLLGEFKPTVAIVRDGHIRAARVGDRAWLDLPYDISTQLITYFDSADEPVATTMGKTPKYLTCLFAPASICGIFPADDIGLIEETAHWDALREELAVHFSGEDLEEAMIHAVDGAMVVSRYIWDEWVKHSLSQLDKDDPWYAEKHARIWNATCGIVRIITPEGEHKGLAIKAEKYIGPWAILSSKENLKVDIKSTDNNWHVWLQPVAMHANEDVAVDAGSMLAHHWFFAPDGDVTSITADIRATFEKFANKIVSKEMTPMRDPLKQEHTEDTISGFQAKYNAILDAGLTVDKVPFLYKSWMRGIRDAVVQENRWLKFPTSGINRVFRRYDKMRWEIRGSVRVQVVSETWARIAMEHGFGWNIGDNEIRLFDGFGVINAKTFHQNYDLHGGWDLDDKLILVSFGDTSDSKLKFFGYRQPTSWGEYSIYTPTPDTYSEIGIYVLGKWITLKEANTKFVPEPVRFVDSRNFPVVDINATLTERNNTYWTLPSKTLQSTKATRQTLTKRMIADEARNSLADNPLGSYVNAIGAYYAMVGGIPRAQLDTHEEVVDALTASTSVVDHAKVTEARLDIINELMTTTGGRIDAGLIGRISPESPFDDRPVADKLAELGLIPDTNGIMFRIGWYFETQVTLFDDFIAKEYDKALKAHLTKLRLMPRSTSHAIDAKVLNEAMRNVFAHTPRDKEFGFSYSRLQEMGNMVWSIVKDVPFNDMSWAINGYLLSFGKADQNLCNGMMFSRYLQFISRLNNSN